MGLSEENRRAFGVRRDEPQRGLGPGRPPKPPAPLFKKAAECACGHLLPSHMARGCVAVVRRLTERGNACLVDDVCGCLGWRPRT